MNNGNPIVSVSCLAYNQENFIGEALDGIMMQQTDFPFEVIVHDDASTDQTPAIIRDYAWIYPDIIRAIYQEVNQFSKTGMYPYATHVFPAARGKYIAICDGDDYWTDPHKLQRQVDFMEKNPAFSACFHDYLTKIGGRFIEPPEDMARDYTSEELVAIGTAKFYMASSTILFRNYYNAETKRDFEEFKGHYMTMVLLGTFGGCKFIDHIRPSVYRFHDHNTWAGLPRDESALKITDKLARIRKLMEEKGNPKWIALRKGVE
jgi:glycosyltransferase involved in cell wall biosynthesis